MIESTIHYYCLLDYYMRYYSDFLKNAYQEAKFRITKTTVTDTDALIDVKVHFPDGEKKYILFLNKDAGGNWKIFKEISDQ